MGHSVPGVVTGKPVILGGSLGRREATGRGVGYLVSRTMDVLKMDPANTTAVVQGYGNVGSVTAHSLTRYGVKVIGVSDVEGAVFNAKGINLKALDDHVTATRTVCGFAGAEAIPPAELLISSCDILAPCALERQIHADNAAQLKCRILAEGANGPTTPEADAILEQRGDVFVIPDILCNAGGVVVSYFEWVQDLQSFFWTETEVTDKLFRILEGAFTQTLDLSRKRKISMRFAALSLGIQRVYEAKQQRGFFP
jgi:glutamate dehydrogenase (NAD(P)+)